ncbi:RNA polymerase sigma factor [Gordonibacter pamelaeae]|nr:sigma-70 family RNA polymerase sigma factor [Gordonibacter pamelaeae]MCB6310861.1 sigma-70 family RNA polymerase sigma factor [Gordonibacter pamelaeae]HJH73663.1 sigma-70 family RNA polymerase sigma factor [Eggerthellaceae bacterium]
MRRRNQSADERPLRPDAFIRQAMGAWGGSVWRLALAQTGSKEDAEDVYQDVFLRLAQSATEFSSQEHLKAWLLRVAVNRCHDVARLRSRRPAVPLDSMPFEPSDAGPLSPDEVRALWEAVGELPESMRVVIHLYYQEGYSGKEIAGLLGLEPSTVRTRLQRARAQLKISLGGVDYDQSEPVQSDDGPSGATCPSAG